MSHLPRRAFLQTCGAAAIAGLNYTVLPPAFGKTDKVQRFQVGFAPATDGTLESYWMRMKALSEVGFRNIEVDNGMIKSCRKLCL